MHAETARNRYVRIGYLAIFEHGMRQGKTSSETAEQRADELFRSRLDSLIVLLHPLAQLVERTPWAALADALSATLPPAMVDSGRPALPVRLMEGLLYLNYANDLFDEEVY